eukprot:15371660-Alexandrium_andersonii.AAC.1
MGPPTGASGPVVGPSIGASGVPVRPAGASQRTRVCAGGGLAAIRKAAPSLCRLAATEPPATPPWGPHQRVRTC